MSAVAKPEDGEVEVNPLARLREPFPAHQISKLPKESKRQADERKTGTNAISNCSICGGWHHKNAVHLDYVGHAALTDRLLDTDLEWDWAPLAFGSDGLPALDRNGGLWIKLTVCGKTRIGYGSADGKQGGDAMKELIGDALRNAAMRFGAALDLWHKGQLHIDEETPPSAEDAPDPQTVTSPPEERVERRVRSKPSVTLNDRAKIFATALRACETLLEFERTYAKGAVIRSELDRADPELLADLETLAAHLACSLPDKLTDTADAENVFA